MLKMSRFWAVVLVTVLALYVAVLELAAEFILIPADALYSYWYSPAPIVVGVVAAAVIGALVRHVGVLVVPFVAVGIQVSLDAAGYVRPWHEITPTINPGWPITIAVGLSVAVGLLSGAMLVSMQRAGRTASEQVQG